MDLNEKKILVTGGAGFVPSHVVDALVAAGAEVTVIDNFSSGRRTNLNQSEDRLTIIDMDVRDWGVEKVIREQDVVIHMAANADVPKSVESPDYDFQHNVLGGYNVLRACLGSRVQKVLFASSAAVYGEPEYTPIDERHPTNPRSPYGAAKLAIEKLGFAYYESFNLPFTAIRIFNTYGTRQPRYVMYDLLRKLYKDASKLEVLGKGDQVRDYSYVTDTANCFVLAAQSDRAIGQVYNVAGNSPLSIKDLVHMLVETLSLKGVEVTFTGESWRGDIVKLIADVSKGRDDLGFRSTVTINEGIQLLNTWLLEQEKLRVR